MTTRRTLLDRMRASLPAVLALALSDRALRVIAMMLAMIVVSCSVVTLPPDAPAANTVPHLRPQPAVVIDEAPTDMLAVAALAGAGGELHVLFKRRTGGWRHALLNLATGAQQVQTVPESSVGGRAAGAGFDLALDSDAVLHAIVEGHHLAWRGGAWAREPGPPCHAFIRGGPPLRCVGPPPGAAEHRIDWFWVVPLPLPWASEVKQLVLYVQEHGRWRIDGTFNAGSNRDVGAFQGVATPSGDIHAVYARGRWLLFGDDYQFRYELMPVQKAADPAGSIAQQRDPGAGADRSVQLGCPHEVSPLSAAWRREGIGLAVDPVTGQGLLTVASVLPVICQHSVGPDGLGDVRAVFHGNYRRTDLAALGGGRFAMLLTGGTIGPAVPMSIATLHDGRWSAAQELGRFSTLPWYKGQAPLVPLGNGRMALVLVDARKRLVMIGFDPVP